MTIDSSIDSENLVKIILNKKEVKSGQKICKLTDESQKTKKNKKENDI